MMRSSLLLEGKDLTKFKGQVLKQKQTAIKVAASMPKPATFRRKIEKDASKKMEAVVAKLDRSMNALHRRLERFDIEPDLFKKKMTIALRNAYMDAYTLGTVASGLVRADDLSARTSVDEINYLKAVLKEEGKYFDKFLEDVIAGASRTSVKNRIKAYSAAIRSVFQGARVIQLPDDSVIHWVLESRNPCPECRILHRLSPFTKSTLPTTPKGGDTSCLHNCFCSLRVVKGKSKSHVDAVTRKNKSAKVVLKKLEKSRKGR